MKEIWSIRNFRLLFIGQATSAFGNTLVPVALSFAVLDQQHSASALGIVLGAESVAELTFLLIGGVVADRVSRKWVMLIADLARGIAEIVLGLLIIEGRADVATMATLGAVQGVCGAMFTPAAGGILRALVPRNLVQRANTMSQTAQAAATVAGPAVAGVFVLTVGPGWAILLDGATFLVNVGMLAGLSLAKLPALNSSTFLTDLADGWRDFWSRKWFCTSVVGCSIFNMCYAAFSVLGPLASIRLYSGASSWSEIAAAMGLGLVSGGLLSAKITPARPLAVGFPLIGLAGLAPLAMAMHDNVIVVAIAAAFGTCGLNIFEVLWRTAVQLDVPEQLISRATAYDYFGSLAAFPIGLMLAGPLAEAASLRTVLYGLGIGEVAIAACLLCFRSIRDVGKDTQSENVETQAEAV